MYKKILTTLLLGACGGAAMAQSTLTAANSNPLIGELYLSHPCDTTGVTPGALGAGITWNFSNVHSTSVDSGRAVACGATPQCGLFPGSSLALVSPANSTTTYMIAGSSTLSQNGYYQSATQNATFTNPADQFQYPFTYMSAFTDNYAGTLTYSGITANQSGSEAVSCDGFGTLITPAGTFNNVLRVHSVQLYVDSLSIFDSTIITTYQLDAYNWYMPGYHSPLMLVAYTTSPTSSNPYKIVSYSSQGPTALGNIQQAGMQLQIFPNPVINELNVQLETESATTVIITLVDVTGRQLTVVANKAMHGKEVFHYNTSAIAKGLYFVRVQTATGVETRKIEIQ